MDLKSATYLQHNFHNEKVNEWISENLVLSTYAYEWGGVNRDFGGNEWGCDCDTYWNEEEREHYVELEDGTEELYQAYYEKLDAEDLIADMEKAFGPLSEEEKEEILDVVNVRVYACPICNVWSVDGDNC